MERVPESSRSGCTVVIRQAGALSIVNKASVSKRARKKGRREVTGSPFA
jgi:hypothetical protein